MKIHRVRIADPVDGEKSSHIFVEVEKDRWLETEKIPSECSHSAVHKILLQEEESGEKHVGFNSRAFKIGMIKNWYEGLSIKQPIPK